MNFKRMLVDFGVMAADEPLQIAEDENTAAIGQAQVHGLSHVRSAEH